MHFHFVTQSASQTGCALVYIWFITQECGTIFCDQNCYVKCHLRNFKSDFSPKRPIFLHTGTSISELQSHISTNYPTLIGCVTVLIDNQGKENPIR